MEPLSELVIELKQHNWLGGLQNLKYISIRRCIIFGSRRDIGSSELNPTDLISIVKEITRLNCSILTFRNVNFILFRDIMFCYSLPVKSIHIDLCSNMEMFIPQIFNMNICAPESNRKYSHQYTVTELAFNFYSTAEDFLQLKNRMQLALQYNYIFQSIQYPRAIPKLTEYQAKKNEEFNRQINQLLRRNIVLRSTCLESILTLFLIKKYRSKTLLNFLPRDIILIISRILFSMIFESQYILGISNKLDDPIIETLYNKSTAPKGHQDLLIINYDGIKRTSSKPLKELKCKQITVNKLVVIESITDVGIFSSHRISNIFRLLIDTKVKILEIQNVDLPNVDIRQTLENREYLNGDDSRMRDLLDSKYPEPSLTNIYLVKCKNSQFFAAYFIKIMNKTINLTENSKERKYTYTSGEELVNSPAFDISADIISITVDRQTNRINIGNDKPQ